MDPRWLFSLGSRYLFAGMHVFTAAQFGRGNHGAFSGMFFLCNFHWMHYGPLDAPFRLGSFHCATFSRRRQQEIHHPLVLYCNYCINVGRTHLKKYGNKYSLRAYHSNEGACGLTPFPVWLFPTLHTCAGGIHRLKTPQPQRSGGNVSVGGFSGSNCVSM